ncbi:GDSL esterase/lipase At5g14450-like [Aristolochia californica]|uniref:GDSL esterase/lipase At5g14450-like n=1 Tax=Aristolochia californica TaxID=171875 RepID=UPI0035D53B7C
MGLVGLALVFVLLVLGFHGGAAEVGKCYFPAIFNFGDSNSATGASLSPPNGQTFFGKPSGRASDGRLVIDFLAETLGLPYLSPYSESAGNNYRHGANFAAGGATIRPQNSGSFSPPSLNVQFGQFLQFKKLTSDHYGQGISNLSVRAFFPDNYPQPEDFANALYTLDIGQNDLNAGFQSMSEDQLLATLPDTVNQFSQDVHQLYEAGARRFWIHNTGPVGCLPNSVIYYPNKPNNLDQFGCVNPQNEAAKEFNRELKDTVNKLRENLPDAAFTYVDVYTAKYALISDAQKQGFVEPFKFCCGRYQEGGQVIRCGAEGSSTCEDPSKFVSWDGAHYTEAANKGIANHILYGGLSDTGASVFQACYRSMH